MDPSRLVHIAMISGNIDLYIDRVQQILIAQHKYPETNREQQQIQIKQLTIAFKALLQAKSRQKRIQDIRKHHRRNTHHSSTRPTHDTPRGICIRDILKEQVAGSGQRKNTRRKEEGYIQSRLGKHVTKGW